MANPSGLQVRCALGGETLSGGSSPSSLDPSPHTENTPLADLVPAEGGRAGAAAPRVLPGGVGPDISSSTLPEGGPAVGELAFWREVPRPRGGTPLVLQRRKVPLSPGALGFRSPECVDRWDRGMPRSSPEGPSDRFPESPRKVGSKSVSGERAATFSPGPGRPGSRIGRSGRWRPHPSPGACAGPAKGRCG